MKAALEKAPDDAKTRLAAAKWALTTGQIDEAKKQADEALRIDKSSMEAKVVRGIVSLFHKELRGRRRGLRERPSAKTPTISPPGTTWPWPSASRQGRGEEDQGPGVCQRERAA